MTCPELPRESGWSQERNLGVQGDHLLYRQWIRAPVFCTFSRKKDSLVNGESWGRCYRTSESWDHWRRQPSPQRHAFLKTRSRVVYFCIVVPGRLYPVHRWPLITICWMSVWWASGRMPEFVSSGPPPRSWFFLLTRTSLGRGRGMRNWTFSPTSLSDMWS